MNDDENKMYVYAYVQDEKRFHKNPKRKKKKRRNEAATTTVTYASDRYIKRFEITEQPKGKKKRNPANRY